MIIERDKKWDYLIPVINVKNLGGTIMPIIIGGIAAVIFIIMFLRGC
jgi:hypothetical protein